VCRNTTPLCSRRVGCVAGTVQFALRTPLITSSFHITRSVVFNHNYTGTLFAPTTPLLKQLTNCQLPSYYRGTGTIFPNVTRLCVCRHTLVDTTPARLRVTMFTVADFTFSLSFCRAMLALARPTPSCGVCPSRLCIASKRLKTRP